MEKTSRTSRETFQSIAEGISIDYAKDVNDDGTRVFANITKDGNAVGSMTYNSRRGNLSIGIMGYDTLTNKQKDALLAQIAEDMKTLRK